MPPDVAAPAPRHSTDHVVRYYDQTWLDYRLVWLNRANLAMHFGYRDATARRHRDALGNGNRVLAELAGVTPGTRVLDAGCGVGGSACWLAVHRGAEVVGITVVPRQVQRARREADRRGLGDRVRFEIADYAGTSFPDRSFDVAWAMESLCHAADKGAFYREMARLLRPGGRLLVAEYLRGRRDPPPAVERRMRAWCEGWAMPDLDTAEEHLAAARAAGFVALHLRDATAYTRRSLCRLCWCARLATPLDALLWCLRIRTAVQHGNTVASRLQYPLLREGHWFYGILTGSIPPG